MNCFFYAEYGQMGKKMERIYPHQLHILCKFTPLFLNRKENFRKYRKNIEFPFFTLISKTRYPVIS